MQLVADIGGTNARLAAVGSEGHLAHLKSAKNAAYDSFEGVLSDYLDGLGTAAPKGLVVAVAGPVSDGVGRLTNLPWVVDQRKIKDRFGCATEVINDLTALGYAALGLHDDQLIDVDDAAPESSHRQALVVGIGTGFNVSSVIDVQGRLVCPTAEAGHASLPSRVTRALDDLKPGISKAFNTVESLFAGQGRRRFLSEVTGRTVESATPLIAAVGRPGNEANDAALDAYARLIGHLLLDLKLNYMPGQGIFLAGGVARSSLIAHRAGLCRDVLNVPDQFLPTPVPVRIINDDAAALAGCLKFANLI